MVKAYGNITNRIMEENTEGPLPQVGMGATELLFSDRHAFTIVSVSKAGLSFVMQRDKVTPTGGFGSQDYKYEPDLEGVTREVTRRANGTWRIKGCNQPNSGGYVKVGVRDEYYDYSF